jgi:hypothetical protein
MQSVIGQVPEGEISHPLTEGDCRFSTIVHLTHLRKMRGETYIKK